jgi:O-antigen/teichoic acid export membrane protein
VSVDRINPFLLSVLRIGLSGAGTQVVVFLSLPILSRLYGAENFGAWALIQSTALLIGAIATCRYELAVVLPDSNEEAASLLGMGLVLAIAVSLCTALALYWSGPWLPVDVVPEALAVWSIPLLVILTATNQLAMAWCTRAAAFTLYGAAQLAMAVLTAALPAYLASSGGGATGLVTGTLMANGLVTVALWIWAVRQLGKYNLLTGFHWRQMIAAGRQYRAYPFFMTPYSLVGALRERAVYFLLGTYAGGGEVGLYAMAQRLANAPNSLVSSALRPVFFQRIAQGAIADIGKFLERILIWLVLLAVPPVTFFCFFPERIVTLLFGPGWGEAATYVLILSLPMLPLLLGNWMDRYFDVLGRQRLAFGMEFVFSLLAVAVLAGAIWLGADIRTAVLLQAIVMFAYFTVWIGVLFSAADIRLALLGKVAVLAVATGTVTALCVMVISTMAGFLGSAVSFLLLWMVVLATLAWSKKPI